MNALQNERRCEGEEVLIPPVPSQSLTESIDWEIKMSLKRRWLRKVCLEFIRQSAHRSQIVSHGKKFRGRSGG